MNADEPSPLTPAHDHNRRAWDQRVRRGGRFTKPATDDDVSGALAGFNSSGWLDGELAGRKLLCLAAGGGRQSIYYALAGAQVTVVDISPAMLELDRAAAAERGLEVRTVEASMDHLPMLQAGEFDVVIQPVSTCYVPDVRPIYREVARVLRAGGLYFSQHKQPTSLQADIIPSPGGYELIEPYYRSGPLPAVVGSLHREEGTLEFLHRWEELVGLMCRAGFAVEDLVEPQHAEAGALRGSFKHRSQFVAPYVRIKARRNGYAESARPPARLWTPG